MPSHRFWFATYDFSNSGYVLVFQAFLFPILLTAVAGEQADSIWAAIVALSSILAIIVGPFLGKLADKIGKAQVFTFLVTLSALLAASTPLLWRNHWFLLAASFVIFNTLFELSQTLYDSFLTNISSNSAVMTKISSFAWGFGYLGGAIFAAAYFGLSKIGWNEVSMLAFFAILFLVLSIPAMLSFRKLTPKVKIVHIRLRDLLHTKPFIPIKQLFIYWVIADCVSALVYFAPLYFKQEIGLSTMTLGALVLGMQLLAFPLTVVLGKLAASWGHIKVIRLGLVIWTISLLGLIFASSLTHIIIVSVGFAFVFGSTQAILRANYASRIPKKHSGEAMGYFAVAQKSASVLAPGIVWIVTLFSDSLRPAFAILFVLILIAAIVSGSLPEVIKRKTAKNQT